MPQMMMAEQKLQGTLEDVANARRELQSQRLFYNSLHRTPQLPDTSTIDAASETSQKCKRGQEDGELSDDDSHTPGHPQTGELDEGLHDDGVEGDDEETWVEHSEQADEPPEKNDDGVDGDDEGTRVEHSGPAAEPPLSDPEDICPQQSQTFSYVLTTDLPLEMQVDQYDDTRMKFEIRTPYIVAEIQAKNPDPDESKYEAEDEVLYVVDAKGKKKRLERGPSPPPLPDYDPVDEDDDLQHAQSIRDKNTRAQMRYIREKKA
jgi:hypothetical protein